MPAESLRRLEAELGELAGAPVELERPTRDEHGDYATNVALRTGPAAGRQPRELAEELAGSVTGVAAVERAEVAGPGFLNLWLEPSWFGEALAEILEAGDGYGASSAAVKERIQVEMVSANPTGPLTVGSARNGAYGDAVARLLELAGHEVEREYYYNDVGRQIDLFRESVEARRRGEEPPEDGYSGAYIEEIAARDGDPVELMMAEIRSELEQLRIRFDSWMRQVDIEAEVPAVLERIETYEAEGTLWARTTAHGDDKDRPLVRSADGSYLYFAADVAYVLDKLSRGFDRAIYVLGADHHGYVGRLKAAASLLGFDDDRLEVLIYQLVSVVEQGEAKRMSKRRGDVVFLDELVEKIGVDATRWYLVSRGHDQPIEIDVDLAAEQTQKNPGLLRPVRARTDCRDHAQRRRCGAVGRRACGARSRRARAREAPGRVSRRRRGGDGAACSPCPTDLRNTRRRRLPPLLPPPPRARSGGGTGLPTGALQGYADGDRALPRPRRG